MLGKLAVLAVSSGQPEVAARLIGAADGLRADAGLSPSALSTHTAHEDPRSAVLTALGAAGFSAAWAAGRALALDEMIALAGTVTPPERPAGAAQGQHSKLSAGPLTPCETEVLRLVAKGRTDREIASALFIGSRTVQTHLANLFAKLGVNARAEAAAVAVRRGLI